jgi:uncharacterized NAD(P)/FAD-binding protein YdhS
MRANELVAVSGGSRRSFGACSYLLDPLASLLAAGNPRHLHGAWTAHDLESIGVADRVLVLGAPLLGVDVVFALSEQGHRGTVRLVSPRGLLHSVRAGIAPEAAERLAALIAEGRLDVCAGDVTGAAAYGDTFVVDILPRGRTLHLSERYDWIVSCTLERDQR